MLRAFAGCAPEVAASAWIAPSAEVIGRVRVGPEASVWPQAVLRGDLEPIEIGARSNIQDGTIAHTTSGAFPVRIYEDVTVGHRAILHGCEVGPRALIGMGAILMDGVVVEPDVIVAAGALVPEGKRLKSGWLYLGVPAKPIRPLTDEERTFLRESAAHYVQLAKAHRESGHG
ncbi:MAG: gamma carbonic anhydrase family protein [Zetaproteobacteria bacterium]|nr:MAG: gamma carbonic anhydrase family protein [Zetaproteobacteria bacterium]